MKPSIDDKNIIELLGYVAKSRNYKMAVSYLTNEYAESGLKICLFGAGGHTEKIFEIANSILLSSIVAIVDNNKVGRNISNMVVCDSGILKKIEYDFIVMSSDVNQESMKKELIALGVPSEKIVDIYNNDAIVNYLFNKDINTDNCIESFIVNVNNAKNPLLVISNSMTLGHLKLFKYLSSWYELFIATSADKIQSLKIDTSLDDFANFNLFKSPMELIELASGIKNGKILTINGVYWNALGASVVVAANVKVFSFFVDIMSSAHVSQEVLNTVCNAKMESFSEEILWRWSDGVIFKESIELAQKNIEFFKPRKFIQFYDYCDTESVLSVGKNRDRLSFVYAGGLVSPNTKDHAHEIHMSILDVADVLAKHDCRLDIFNAYDGGDDTDFDVYKDALSAESSLYFSAVLPSKLPFLLSSYDVGIVLFDFARGMDRYDSGYFKYGSFTKIIAYIEAEIPIVISKEAETMASFVEENGLGVAIFWHELNELPQKMTSEKIELYRQNVRKFKYQLSYKEHISKLVDFLNYSDVDNDYTGLVSLTTK